MRQLGFTVANVVSTAGIMPGSSALVSLAETNPNEAVIRPEVFQHVIFDTRATPDQAYPRSLMGVIAAFRQTCLSADHYFEDQEHYEKNGQPRRRPAFNPALEALGPVINGDQAVVFEPGSILMVDRAAHLAREFELAFHLVASGDEWRRPDLVQATEATFILPLDFPEIPKLPEEDDWDQVSLDHLRNWDWAPGLATLLRQQKRDVALTTYRLGERSKFRNNLKLALDRGFSEADAVAGLTTIPAGICGVEDQLGTLEAGKIANLTIVDGSSYFDPKAKITELWIDGRIHYVRPGETDSEGPDKDKDEGEDKKDEEKEPSPRESLAASSPMDQRGPLANPPAVLIRNALIWTCGPEGNLTNSDLLILDGKVKAVGKNLSVPRSKADEAVIIDGTGLQVTPGLIDAHSHSMILGSVNESTLPSSAMVRIGDVVNSETANIYRQLAGGLTVANLLHGSANPIGGQNAIIKLKDGASPEALKFEGAPPGIKFALGENVKQSNWGDDRTTRFPQSRMGVPTFMANRFTAAKQYLEDRRKRKRKDPPVPPNLELEALGEIIEGKRWIHCHSYRQDEILAFLRTMESFGVQVGTLQHVLEGYKIADEIAAHGAGGSCFSDWWAYKFEVYDAIPHAGSLMHERGVLTSFNSDSSDLARRMNQEAAKAVKYGGTSEMESLLFVTLNPAKQLRIDKRVGSLEPGKDGDFVLWSGSPLAVTSRCLQTWIEGHQYFDIEKDPDRTRSRVEERDKLLAKAKKVLEDKSSKKSSDGESSKSAEALFFRVCLELLYDTVERHCLDEDHDH